MAQARPQVTHRTLGVLGALLLVVSLLSAVPAPAGAADTGLDAVLDRAAQLQDGLVFSEPVSATPSGASYQAIERCFNDPEGDVIDFDTRAPANEPRADIIQHCINYGPSLSLTVQNVAPTNPETDINWEYGTFVGWFIDVSGDGEGEFFVDYSLDLDSRLQAQVIDLRVDPPSAACDVSPSYTPLYGASNIRPSCIGGANTVRVAAAMMYDTTGQHGEAPAGRRFFDTVPGGDAFEPPTTTAGPRGTARLGGAGRIQTAVQISQYQFPTPGVPSVYLARGDVFADAVVGGTLTDGPILLVNSCGPVHGDVSAEIARLNPGRVVALGGESAICSPTLAEAAAGRPTDRLAGSTRIGTAAAISRFLFPEGAGEVYIARQDLFADAVVGGVLSAGPILLVPRQGNVPQEVLTEIDRLDPDVVIALGGPGAVFPEVLQQSAAAAGAPAHRLSGPTRLDTAVAISSYEFPATADELYLARADLFADAVVGGVLTGGPILLVPSCGDIPQVVQAEISRAAPERVVALGGPSAVCDDMLTQAANS